MLFAFGVVKPENAHTIVNWYHYEYFTPILLEIGMVFFLFFFNETAFFNLLYKKLRCVIFFDASQRPHFQLNQELAEFFNFDEKEFMSRRAPAALLS